MCTGPAKRWDAACEVATLSPEAAANVCRLPRVVNGGMLSHSCYGRRLKMRGGGGRLKMRGGPFYQLVEFRLRLVDGSKPYGITAEAARRQC
jgi:hypothetical protein